MKTNDRFVSRPSGPSLLTLLACAAFVPLAALCQDSASGPASATNTVATNDPARLPVVTVVAQKEPQPADTLPLSVTAVTRQTLQDADITVVKEASIYSPNTFVNEFSARALSNPFFRGIGGSPLNPGVTTYIDGVPQLNTYSASIEFLDVNQVEFVRGPQGALFGRNTVGGLINITSRVPSDVLTGAVEGSYGNYNFRDIRGSISGPLAKDLLNSSLAAGYSARDGYTVNDFNGQDVDHREDEFGKGQILYKVNDRFNVRLIAFGEHDHDGDYALGDLNYIRANPNHVNYDFSDGFNHRDVASGTLLADYLGDAADISSITGFVWWQNHGLTDLDYTPFPGNTRDNQEEQHQFTQEFRFASSKDKPIKLTDDLELGWQAGVFLFTQSYEQTATNNFAPPNAIFSSLSTADLDDWGVGVYGQAKLTAWEKLDFTAGLRYDYEDKQADLFNSTAALFGLPVQNNLRDSFSQVSPQFGLAWHFMDAQMLYGSISRGYKAGGFNPIFPAGGAEYDPEYSWNYEVGLKSTWLDGKLETSLALFYIDWRDIQLNQAVAIAPGQFYIANAGAADSKGVEFAAKYRPIAGWDLFGSVGYNDSEFLSGSTAFNANAFANQSIQGNPLPYTPCFTANAGTQFSWTPCRAATLYARAEVTVYGNYQYDAFNTQSQSTYSLANFRAGVRCNRCFVEGWANNAFDSHYVPIAIQYGALGAPSGYIGETGAPVTYGIRAGLQF